MLNPAEYCDKDLPFPSIVTVGTFDGVHLGHQKILENIRHIAKQKQLQSVVLTFFPHPRMILQKEGNIKLISSLEERIELIKKLKINHVVVRKFDEIFAAWPAERFVSEVLVKQLKAKCVIVGYDHRFGQNRSADINRLRYFGKQFNFEVIEIPAKDIDQVSVSSTVIRKDLNRGDVETVSQYLGRNFTLTGTVVKGHGLGKTLGFATANIQVRESYKLIPKNGVYIVKSHTFKPEIYGLLNIGVRPTFDGKKQTNEVHFLNFDETLYDKKVEIQLLKRLRAERKFNSVDGLVIQLKKDREEAMKYMLSHQNQKIIC